MDEYSFNHLHVAILSSPGMGHLTPVLVLANRLAVHHNVRVTVLVVTTATVSPSESKQLLKALSPYHKLVQVIELPPVDISHLVNPSTQVVTQLCLTVRAALPLVRSAVSAMNPIPDALFVDHFCTETLPIAAEFNMAKYVYVPSTAWFTALFVYSPVLDQEIYGQYVDQLEPLKVPGCKPVRPEDVVDPMLDRNDQQYAEYIRIGNEIPLFDGVLCNSWEDLEATTFQAFMENNNLRLVMKTPVYPIGPLTRSEEPVGPSDLVRWLDRQPKESVLFVSFGSGGMLSAEQTTELAWGLELSRQRFVWVVRPPTTGRSDDAFFSPTANDSASNAGLYNYLPDGFLTRTSDVGFVGQAWVPQVEILNHPSVGGFVSHCGWNSTLESISSGVPMVAWPLYAEQRLNATLLAEEVGIAARTRVLPTKGVVGREEIEMLVRSLMEGKEGEVMRDKVRQLRNSAADCLGYGGSSHKSMCDVLLNISVLKKGNRIEMVRE